MRDEFFCQKALLGEKSQEKLKQAKIAIVGLGGLGSAVAHLLVRMGVGSLHLYDADIISLSNLSRQHLYRKTDLQKKKVLVAKEQLLLLNPNCNISCYDHMITQIDDFKDNNIDMIIDGTDNFAARKIINLFCEKEKIPWIHGAAIEETGTIIVFDPKLENQKSFSEVYNGKEEDLHDCGTGIIISTTTIIASIQARFAIDLILKNDKKQKIYRFNGTLMSLESYEL